MMRRHELDPVSLTFGFAFTGLGLLFLLDQADQAFRLRWVWPLLLLALGAGILIDLTRPRPNREVDREVVTEVEGEADTEVEGKVDGEVDPVDNREHRN